MPLIPIDQYAPDSDFTVPGVIVSCSALVPSVRGYKAAPAPTDPGYSALADTCLGAVVAKKLDATTRFIAGSGTKLYEFEAGSWIDRSRVSGGAYNATSDQRWSFAQFGNVTIATNKGDTLQASSSTAFADISGAPKAKLVETVGQFVFVADTNDVSFGDSPDRWWCSAIGDYTDWTPDVATQCVSGRLTSSPGRINAIKRLGDSIVAYKDRSMFIGSYVGAPEVWSFQEIPGQIGCMAAGGIADLGAAHIFVGYDQFWMFDGSRPTPIGNPIKETFYADIYPDFAYRIKTVHDRQNSNVYFFYPSRSGGGALDSALVYNYRIGKWGRDNRSIEQAIEFISTGLTFDSDFATTTTFADVDAGLTFESQLLVSGQPAPAYFDLNHKVQILTGAGGSWSLTTNDFGDDSSVTTVTRVKPRFLSAPTTCQMTNYYRMVMGESLTSGVTTTYSSGRFDFIRSSRWHRFMLNGTGGGEISGLDVQATVNGNE